MNEAEAAKLLKAQEPQEPTTNNSNYTSPTTHTNHNQPLASAHKGTVATYCNSMVMTSRLLSGKIWTQLRNLFKYSRFGSMAFGIAVVYCAIHLFAAMRRRNIPRRITSSQATDTNSNNTNANTNINNTNNNNNNNNNNNRDMYKSTNNTTTRQRPTKQKSVQQYGGEEQGGGGGGVWSSMTKLMSDAVSLK